MPIALSIPDGALFYLEAVVLVFGVVVVILHVLALAAAGHAILWGRTSQGAIAWAMALVFIPWVTLPLYLVFGLKRFHGYVEAHREGASAIDHVANITAAAMKPAHVVLRPERERYSAFENLAKLPYTTGNVTRLLVDGNATFDAIFQAIDSAQHYILVQFFIVRDDALGQRLAQHLIAKAKAGVKVMFLYDQIGCWNLPKRYQRELRQAGVKFQSFRTMRSWRNRLQINFRNHRKIVVIDGEVAFVGGHNVGIEYVGLSKRFGRWRDTHVELRGPAVCAVQMCFIQDWHWATGEVPALHMAPLPTHTTGTQEVLVVPSGPADAVETGTLLFLSAISTAKHRLWITSPYFVPDESVFSALQLAALRGVDVRIMLPERPDHLLVYLSAFSYLDDAEKVGVKIYRYQDGFLHQKVMLIDDDLSAVGTANLDNRSLRLNFEITLVLLSRSFAAQVAAMLEEDFRQCRRVLSNELQKRSIVFRLAVRLSRLLSPIQ